MIRFKSALDTVQSEIAARERQGIKPIPVTRKTLYRQATVNTVTDKPRVTETSVTDITERHGHITESVTENGTRNVTDKPVTEQSKRKRKEKQVDKVCTLESHTVETSETKTAAQRQAEYRKANAEAIRERDRARKALQRTK